MQALNPRQQAFVDALFVLGPKGTNTLAAKMAGYEGTDDSLRVQAMRLAHSDKIQAAIREEAQRRQTATVPALLGKLEQIALDDTHRQQLDAVKHGLGIAGVSPKIQHEVTHKTDRAGLIAEIKGMVDLLKALGVPVDLGRMVEPPTIDVTPTEQ